MVVLLGKTNLEPPMTEADKKLVEEAREMARFMDDHHLSEQALFTRLADRLEALTSEPERELGPRDNRWCQPGDRFERMWILRFDDSDRQDMFWKGDDAEPEARSAFRRCSATWNCTLFQAAPWSNGPASAPTPDADAELVAMRKVAEAAGTKSWELKIDPGEYRVQVKGVRGLLGYVAGAMIGGLDGLCRNRATHIATFDPPMVLRLLDRLTEAEGRAGILYRTISVLENERYERACTLAATQAQLEAARGALNKAADQFAFYADEHAKKGTGEADLKAMTNHGWALACVRAANATETAQ